MDFQIDNNKLIKNWSNSSGYVIESDNVRCESEPLTTVLDNLSDDDHTHNYVQYLSINSSNSSISGNVGAAISKIEKQNNNTLKITYSDKFITNVSKGNGNVFDTLVITNGVLQLSTSSEANPVKTIEFINNISDDKIITNITKTGTKLSITYSQLQSIICNALNNILISNTINISSNSTGTNIILSN